MHSKNVFVLFSKGLSGDDAEVARDTVFEEIRPGADFKPAIAFIKKSCGITVERLACEIARQDRNPLYILVPGIGVIPNSAGVRYAAGIASWRILPNAARPPVPMLSA